MKLTVLAAIAALGIGTTTTSANPVILSFTGNLRTDANVTVCGSGCTLGPANTDGEWAQWAAVVKGIHVSSPSSMTAITFGYGGGTNGAGTVIAQGGFEPYLTLFDASGDFLASTFSGTTCPTGAHTNTNSGQCFDVLLDGGVLASGDYQIAISAFENLSLAENLGSGKLADGFTGLGNLAQGEDLHYAFDVVLTPEPAMVPFLVGAGVALYLFRCHRKEQLMRNKLFTPEPDTLLTAGRSGSRFCILSGGDKQRRHIPETEGLEYRSRL